MSGNEYDIYVLPREREPVRPLQGMHLHFKGWLYGYEIPTSPVLRDIFNERRVVVVEAVRRLKRR